MEIKLRFKIDEEEYNKFDSILKEEGRNIQDIFTKIMTRSLRCGYVDWVFSDGEVPIHYNDMNREEKRAYDYFCKRNPSLLLSNVNFYISRDGVRCFAPHLAFNYRAPILYSENSYVILLDYKSEVSYLFLFKQWELTPDPSLLLTSVMCHDGPLSLDNRTGLTWEKYLVDQANFKIWN